MLEQNVHTNPVQEPLRLLSLKYLLLMMMFIFILFYYFIFFQLIKAVQYRSYYTELRKNCKGQRAHEFYFDNKEMQTQKSKAIYFRPLIRPLTELHVTTLRVPEYLSNKVLDTEITYEITVKFISQLLTVTKLKVNFKTEVHRELLLWRG